MRVFTLKNIFLVFTTSFLYVFGYTQPVVERSLPQLIVDSVDNQAIVDGRTFVGYSLKQNKSLSKKQINNHLFVYEQVVSVNKANHLRLHFKNWNFSVSPHVEILNLRTLETHLETATPVTTDNTYFTETVLADSLVVKIYASEDIIAPIISRVDVVVHPDNSISRGLDDSGSCQVDVECSESNNFSDQVKSVVQYEFDVGQYIYACSGVVVNNAVYDCKPYVLSAMHCITSSDNFQDYRFYFNYQKNGCGSGLAPRNKSIKGCKKLADSNDGGGETGSDFVLFELNSNIPESFDVYYSGWSAKNEASTSGVSIHHPMADAKKISTYKTWLSSTNYSQNSEGFTHWRVNWEPTVNGYGTTEIGSSGSPIFNAKGLIVGTLTGGLSSCQATSSPDYYGKMSYHWTSNPNAENQKLIVWLDPANTGILELEGTYFPCKAPGNNDAGIVSFSNTSLVCRNQKNVSYELKNFGATDLERVNVIVEINGVEFSNELWTGNLKQGETTFINKDLILENGKNTIVIKTDFPNGVTDDNVLNDKLVKPLFVGSTNKWTTISIVPDCNPEEISFELFSVDSVLLVEEINGIIGANAELVACLPAGCYFIKLFDAGGNGLSNDCNSDVSFTVRDYEGNILTKITSEDVYESQANLGFCLDVNTNLEEADVKLFPNPINEDTEQITIALENIVLADAVVELYDISGVLVFKGQAYVFNRFDIDVTKLEKGIFTARVILNNEKEIVKRFVKL